MYYVHIVLCTCFQCFLTLQTELIKHLPNGQRTFAILAAAFNVDVYEARLQLFPKFIEKKMDWIRDISEYLLGMKKRELEDYLAEFLKPEHPLDEIGILIFARMMHKHVAVYFNDIYWTSRVDHDTSKCDAHLIYRGKCVYEDTVKLSKDEWNARKEYLNNFKTAYAERSNHDVDKNVHSTTVHNIIGSVDKTEQDDEDALLKDVSESLDVKIVTKKKPKEKPTLKPTRRSKRIKEQEDALNRSILLSVHSTSKPRTTQNSRKTSADVAAARSLGKAKDKKGKWNVSNFVLKKRKKKHKPRICSSCQKVCKTYIELTQHIKDDHPDFKYKCKYCPKLFNSASWKYQHQDRHRGLRFMCPYKKCAKLCQFGYQLRDHVKKHSRKALYVCSTRDCLKAFNTKRARTFHEKKHSMDGSKNFICNFKPSDNDPPCGKAFERKEYLQQHAAGHKTLKLVSRCGKKRFNWPNSRRYHQQRCDDCKDKLKSTFKYRGSD